MDTEALARAMVKAVRTSLGEDWDNARTYAEPELRRLAGVLDDIATMTAGGEITGAEARSLLRIHRNTTEMVFLAVEGMGILAVENAINAALEAVRETVAAATGLSIL